MAVALLSNGAPVGHRAGAGSQWFGSLVPPPLAQARVGGRSDSAAGFFCSAGSDLGVVRAPPKWYRAAIAGFEQPGAGHNLSSARRKGRGPLAYQAAWVMISSLSPLK